MGITIQEENFADKVSFHVLYRAGEIFFGSGIVGLKLRFVCENDSRGFSAYGNDTEVIYIDSVDLLSLSYLKKGRVP